MPELNWKHHALIQSLLSRGPLTAKEFHRLFEGVTGRNPGTNQAILNDYLLKINKELSYVQFELKACMNQYDGELYYGVVNSVADEQSKLGTKFSPPQIAFYRGIVEAIMNDGGGHGTISNMNALHVILENQIPSASQSQAQSQAPPDGNSIPTSFKNFTMSHKEKALDELVREQWLYCSSEGDIGLGIRSFLDLRSWFRSNEVPSCEFCNEPGIKVEFCPNEGCTVRVHKYCLITKFSQRKATKTCPGCGHSWPYTLPKAEILENWEDTEEPTQQAPAAADGSPQRKRRRNHTVDEPNNDDGSQRKRRGNHTVDEPNNADGSQRKRRRNYTVDESNNAGPSQASGVTSLRRSTRTSRSTSHMR